MEESICDFPGCDSIAKKRGFCGTHYQPLITYPPESYTRDECMALLDACGDTLAGKRHRALIITLWRTGLRLSEALALEPQNIDFDAQTIRVLHGKGNKARTVGFDGRTGHELRVWLTARRRWLGDNGVDAPVFCTRQGGRMRTNQVRQMMPILAKRSGVKKRVHAHGFRHTFAVELSQEGVPVYDIQRLLGHTSLATTEIYLKSLSPEAALKAVRGREW
jgi:site-specific recombinase XerD